ncbi:hemerythrin domain-containing protein [Streptomyces virginiae]|uniref:Hemerythrin n=1 Tax=Streptomyces spororaveus TaxID=284039 RepID=A0ABQ3T6P8_9ACTN|nr:MULTISPECIES: hemerythrin domain-containing protein [Streptomyces]MCX4718239.1 hemerythrin domain-containing protein [Streptomyces virginiae]WSX97081.1 hemerythrin domain-containing protein [Streptomyces goshikiensis]GHI76069.1 hemerythrin [Streptomyces spororaveus]
MCEYCGCQSIKAIAELTAEHDSVVDLISVVRAAHHGADAAEMARVARLITAILLPHTQVEEHGLFPAMSDEFPEQIAALEDEHRRIEKVLGEAADGVPADPGWPSRLMEALALLREHILKEQDGVFPATLAILAPEQWDMVDAARTRITDAASTPTR